MPLKDVVKVSRKTFFNPSGWLGYDMLKTQFTTSWAVLKNLYTVPGTTPVTQAETFEQAAERFKLSDEQLSKTAFNFLIYSSIFVVCAVITVIFSIYLLVHHATFAGFVLGLATTAVFGAYAFRFSFWRFQIKHRKLGCTFQEWLSGKPSTHDEGLPK